MHTRITCSASALCTLISLNIFRHSASLLGSLGGGFGVGGGEWWSKTSVTFARPVPSCKAADSWSKSQAGNDVACVRARLVCSSQLERVYEPVR